MFVKIKKKISSLYQGKAMEVKTQTELIKANYISIFLQEGLQG